MFRKIVYSRITIVNLSNITMRSHPEVRVVKKVNVRHCSALHGKTSFTVPATNPGRCAPLMHHFI